MNRAAGARHSCCHGPGAWTRLRRIAFRLKAEEPPSGPLWLREIAKHAARGCGLPGVAGESW